MSKPVKKAVPAKKANPFAGKQAPPFGAKPAVKAVPGKPAATMPQRGKGKPGC